MFGAVKPGFRSLACNECCRRTLNRKEQLRHRAVSLRQRGFLVAFGDPLKINGSGERAPLALTYAGKSKSRRLPDYCVMPS